MDLYKVNRMLLGLGLMIFSSSTISAGRLDKRSPLVCRDGSIPCADNSKCITVQSRCDRLPDCDDGSDEFDCKKCDETESFYCEELDDCLPLTYNCDGTEDCPSGIDEESCDHVTCLVSDDFMCESDKRCISSFLKCDGTDHCHDGSDEQDCEVPECTEDEFDCYDNGSVCIPVTQECNGVSECPNGNDENSDRCGQGDQGDSKCTQDNGGCEHNCIQSAHGYHCSCNEGYILESNHKTCADIDECEDPHLCSHACSNLDGTYQCDCYEGYSLPENNTHFCRADGAEAKVWVTNGTNLVQLGLDSNSNKTTNLSPLIQAIDFDHANQQIFHIDSTRRTIERSFFDHRQPPSTLIKTFIDNPTSVAYDWINGVLYWSDSGLEPDHEKIGVIVVAKPELRYTLLTAPTVHDPRVLVVDPRSDQCFLYWAQGGSYPGIYSSGLDGSDDAVITEIDNGSPVGLSIDFVQNNLYWLDAKKGTLNRFDLGTNAYQVIRTFRDSPWHPIGLAVFEDWVYWAEDHTKSVYRTYKHRRGDEFSSVDVVLHGLVSPRDIRVYHPYKQPLEAESSSCKVNNGGCSHICLASPVGSADEKPTRSRSTCFCPNVDPNVKYSTSSNGKTCVLQVDSTTTRRTETGSNPVSRASSNFGLLKSYTFTVLLSVLGYQYCQLSLV